MKMIQSFAVDHMRIVPGIFTSRIDDVDGHKVTTYDIRIKRPNREPVIDVLAMHSLEHIIATYLRNNPEWKNEVIYLGPMGCLTGFYLILKGDRAPQELYEKLTGQSCDLLSRKFDIPGNAVYVTYHPVSDWGWNGKNF